MASVFSFLISSLSSAAPLSCAFLMSSNVLLISFISLLSSAGFCCAQQGAASRQQNNIKEPGFEIRMVWTSSMGCECLPQFKVDPVRFQCSLPGRGQIQLLRRIILVFV